MAASPKKQILLFDIFTNPLFVCCQKSKPVLDAKLLPLQVCFLSGTLALGATKGFTKEKAMRNNLLNFDDLENLKLAEDLAKTCFEMYSVTSTGLAPEIAYFHTEVCSSFSFC